MVGQTIYRQGDIILEKVESTELPKMMVKVADKLDIKGETGQSHVLEVPVKQTVRVRGVKPFMPLQQFVEVGKGGAVMVHPQHPALTVPEGVYSVRHVRTFVPQEKPRPVLD